jgi:hypothetical protein
MLHNEGPSTLGATVQNSAGRDLCTQVVNTVWKLRDRKRSGIFLEVVIPFHGKTEINKTQIQGVDDKLHQLIEAFVTAPLHSVKGVFIISLSESVK